MAAQATARAREMALEWRWGQGARAGADGDGGECDAGAHGRALGMAFAEWATPYVVNRINPPDDPARLALSADWRVVGFATALALGVTLLFGMLPARVASSVRPVSALKGEKSRGRRQSGCRE